ncbi:hypothetical protein BB559_005106 [Furculomyces boomerangus]|uniref:Uncharacterized protein n=1 Tax=Furculomyces boomerangus TaxID=61424 RepID=A0A2T9YAR6_9FUNG|nr:hypothetical protein BB559_005106 [Furculomyces boomerangus]
MNQNENFLGGSTNPQSTNSIKDSIFNNENESDQQIHELHRISSNQGVSTSSQAGEQNDSGLEGTSRGTKRLNSVLDEEIAQKEKTLAEFLMEMDNFAPIMR